MKKKNLKSIATILFVLVALAYGWITTNDSLQSETQYELSNVAIFRLTSAAQIRRYGIHLQGRVSKMLSDDSVGSRHQRFIVDIRWEA